MACGTGSVSKYLSDLGYNVIGLDLSDEMLTVASSKQIKNAMFIKGDMTNFELLHKVDCCVCSLDSINHLKDIVEVKKCFDCVYNSLNDGGVFVFDVNTVYKHKNVLGNNTFVFDEEDFFLSWIMSIWATIQSEFCWTFLFITVKIMTVSVRSLMKKHIRLMN